MNDDPTFSLTRSQQLVWTGQQLYPDSPLNNMAFAFHWRKPLDPEIFVRALDELVSVSDAMRLRFTTKNGEVVQYASASSGARAKVLDFSGATGEAEARAWLNEDAARPFDLDGPLFRTALLRLSADRWIWYFNQHHLITDGWGKAVQVDWVRKRYRELSAEEANAGPPPALPAYTDYLRSRSEAAPEPTEEYWREYAGAAAEPARLYGEENAVRTPRSHRLRRELSRAETEEIYAFCRRKEVRSWSEAFARFTVFAAATAAYVYRVTGERRMTIAAPAHHRVLPTDQQTPGLYMELFPLALEVEPGMTFLELLSRVRTAATEFLRHARPGGSSAAVLRPANVLLNFLPRPLLEETDPDFRTEWLHSGEAEPGHHLRVQVYDFDRDDALTLDFDVNESIAGPAQRELLPGQFLDVLRLMVDDPEQSLESLGPGQRERLRSFLPRKVDYPTRPVPEVIRVRSLERPDAVAVVSGGTQLTYGELEARSNQLAHHLLAAGLQAEEAVAVCLDRSLAMIVSLLGILKAGGAYVPIDPDFPVERMRFMYEDCGAKLALVTAEYTSLFADIPGRIIDPVADLPQIGQRPVTVPPVTLRPEQLMYIMYTSGSTGRPKGVMNQYDGVGNRLHWGQEALALVAGEDAVLQKTTYSFDISVYELFWPLMVGARLVFAAPGGHREPDYLREVIAREKITTVHFVPSMLDAFLIDPVPLPTLRRVMCTGEPLLPRQVAAFRRAYPKVGLYNLYGPTEAAIEVSCWAAPFGEATPAIVPLGHPIANVPLIVTGPDLSPRPVGVPGELLIGGIQVARGYHGRPELNAKQFLRMPHPVTGEGMRFYRTGDRIRQLADGQFEFMGRFDQQIKLRGYRIELGEIETRIIDSPMVERTAVLVREATAGSPLLIAYLVAAAGYAENALREALGQQLPSYMIPSHFIVLDELPLTGNGKLDRKALPMPRVGSDSTAEETPLNEFEDLLFTIWREVMGVDRPGRNVSFIDLGGDSLVAIRLMSRINDGFSLRLPAYTVFRYPTIAGLAAHLEDTIRQLLAAEESTLR